MSAAGSSAPDVITLPYLEEYAGGPIRPYLWLHLYGPNGANGAVQGLIDTGADVSVLALGYAQLMGYEPRDLDVEQIHGVAGQVDAYVPKMPCKANVVGLEHFEFEMRPAFIPGQDALWGRADFMLVFGIVLNESARTLSLVLPPGITASPPAGS